MARQQALALILLCAVLAQAAAAPALSVASGPRRRLLQGGGWYGGAGVRDMMSANDAVGQIQMAVDDDNFGSTYAATRNAYIDADAAAYPDDIGGSWWGGGGGGY
ncbi:hypothetical protein Rsub_05342 [Raphidocelis subcapitata]|uniref:Uncharacterized protein n=1 Tax=Raphidocelis subcapitata TaxID=307507 RepID=A0A2V0NY46_9CHLO|nr:hypothetical protein Rsub_05342 [Raphidocelis subcapitata]|eukprot:GBF92259.1 hypothetical protein Rsub_05342 [Raphidocelis subcapitata]